MATRMQIERWIDEWAGSYPWRIQLHAGERSANRLLHMLKALEENNPEEPKHPGTWEEIENVLDAHERGE